MSIQTEFEKALTDKIWPDGGYPTQTRNARDIVNDAALFGAQWAFEMAAKEAEMGKSHSVELRPNYLQHCYYRDVAEDIRTLAKEIGEGR